MHTLKSDRLGDFLKALCEGRETFAIEKSSPGMNPDKSSHRPHLRLVRAQGWDPELHTLGAYRPTEPLKSLVFRPRESVGSIDEPAPESPGGERIVVGVKNCDLSALRIHDHVFLDTQPADPYYAQARSNTILVTTDCTDARDVCFCTAVGEQPYAKQGFDVNLSPAGEFYLVEAGSKRGRELLGQHAQLLGPTDEQIVKQRDSQREEMTVRVRELAQDKGLTPEMDFRAAVEKTVESGLWEEFAADCVECGACNFACCTCHCFLLADGASGRGGSARVKQWDSCLYRDFARVAGGANPRSHRSERLYNRFEKKFSFFPRSLDTYACDGCGRCVEACTGRIDIRDVLRRAVGEC